MKLLLIPGHRTWADHPRMIALRQRLEAKGYAVEMFDPHWPRDDEGNFRIIDVKTHLAAAGKRIKEIDDEVVAVGHSQAGAIVTALAAAGEISAGVSLFGVTETSKRPQSMRRRFGLEPLTDADGISWVYTEEFYTGYEEWDVLADCEQNQCPMLFLAGTRDTRVPVSEVRAGYEAAREPKEFVEIIGEHRWEKDHGCLAQAVDVISKWVDSLDL